MLTIFSTPKPFKGHSNIIQTMSEETALSFEAPHTSTRSRALSVILPMVVIVLFLAGCVLYTHDCLDDPYITYRYARNLARGYGLVWNPGEKPVEGYTTFLWAAVHAPFIAAGISPLLVSKTISALSGIVLIVFVLSPLNLVIQTDIWRVALAIMVAICPALLFYCQSGMETFFFMTLLLLGTFLWMSSHLSEGRVRHIVVASMIFGIAALTRPEVT